MARAIHGGRARVMPTARRVRRGEGGAAGRRAKAWSVAGGLTVALVLASVVTLVPPKHARAQDAPAGAGSAEEALAQRYAPVVYLKRQAFVCDPDGEAYLPVPVETMFGDPAVALREAPGAREVKRGIGGADLFGRAAGHYVDLPGDPEEPGCGYERHYRERLGDGGPVVYAHVATEPGRRGVALQYWFYYYFNDFNDKHESDWEMIQLRFDADSAAEALGQDPAEIALSQHKGGETAAWDGGKLRLEAGRPVVFPSRGSHGNYYAPGVWVGWGANGSGLGCDNTTGPSLRIEPEVRLIPTGIDGAGHPFAWATYDGHWGQREAWVYDGPTGPSTKPQWRAPLAWQEKLRDRSLRLQEGDAIGPSPTGVFCATTRVASDVGTQFRDHPRATGAALAALLALMVGLVVLAAPTLAAAWRVYRPHLGTFVAIGAVLIPLGLVANLIHALAVANPPIERLVEVTERDPVVPLVVGLTVGNIQHLATLLVVGPATIAAVGDVRAGRRPGFRRAYAAVGRDLRALLGAGLRALAIVAGLALTLVGLPWAVRQAVRWAFAGQAIVLDGAGAGGALRASARAVRGRWWRTLGTLAVLLFVAAALGPLVGIPLMILLDAPLALANGVGGVLYAATHPFAIVGGTLLYEQLRGDGDPAAPDRRRPAGRDYRAGSRL